jgi:hypothetical protein
MLTPCFLFAVCLALLPLASAQPKCVPQSFSCAISTYTLKAGDPPYQVCEINATQPEGDCGNYVSMQWFTGTFDKPYGSESVLISM